MAKNMRHPSLDQYLTSAGKTGIEMVEHSVKSSLYTWSLEMDNELVAIFGLRNKNIYDNSAEFWLYTSDAAIRHAFHGMRAARQWLSEMLEIFPHIYGYIDATFIKSVKMAKWLGFTIFDPMNIEGSPNPIIYVEIKRG
jgi:hypothetical protein